MNYENSQNQESQDQNQGFRTMMSGLQFSSDDQSFQATSVLDDILYAPGQSNHNPFDFAGESTFTENVDFSIGNAGTLVPPPLDPLLPSSSDQSHSSAVASSSNQVNVAASLLNQSQASLSNQQGGEVSFPIPGEYLDNTFFGGDNSRRGQSISWILRYGYAKVIGDLYHCNVDRVNCKESYSRSATTSILRHAKRKHNMDGSIG